MPSSPGRCDGLTAGPEGCIRKCGTRLQTDTIRRTPALGGSTTGAHPVELPPGALGNGRAGGYAAHPAVPGITIESLRLGEVRAVDVHAFLGLKPDGNAGHQGILAVIELHARAAPDRVRTLHKKVATNSSVGLILRRAVPVQTRPAGRSGPLSMAASVSMAASISCLA